jgi:hypothetical protein
MNVCDLQTPTDMLRKAVTGLKDTWNAATQDWQDEVRVTFARERLDPLLPDIHILLAAVQQLAEVLQDAHRALRDADNDESLYVLP